MSIKVCEYSRSMSFHDHLILQDQASGERSQDQWSSGILEQDIFTANSIGQYLGSGALVSRLVCLTKINSKNSLSYHLVSSSVLLVNL